MQLSLAVISIFLPFLFACFSPPFFFFASPPVLGAEIGEAILIKMTNLQIESIIYLRVLQIVNTVKQMCNFCVVQVVDEYFYSNLGEASGPEKGNS